MGRVVCSSLTGETGVNRKASGRSEIELSLESEGKARSPQSMIKLTFEAKSLEKSRGDGLLDRDPGRE